MQYKLTTPVAKEDLAPPCSSPARSTPPVTPHTSG